MSSDKPGMQKDFREVLSIIRSGQVKAHRAMNSAMLETYWNIDGYISRQVFSRSGASL